ncbi:hypothetical protein ES319_A05G388700v1 [Gossypium barbadense]|uniref:Uncharacterized protein n=1 Tax=Gossypium barbadense TaxID=3634 RepID=A0A5J5W0H2_GOSBA|nr:hypothetical protein ES319_A05G388700v1 [Gossypium barbadense]
MEFQTIQDRHKFISDFLQMYSNLTWYLKVPYFCKKLRENIMLYAEFLYCIHPSVTIFHCINPYTIAPPN